MNIPRPCPRCNHQTSNINDNREGYCPRCRNWTALPVGLSAGRVQAEKRFRRVTAAIARQCTMTCCNSGPNVRAHASQAMAAIRELDKP